MTDDENRTETPRIDEMLLSPDPMILTITHVADGYDAVLNQYSRYFLSANGKTVSDAIIKLEARVRSRKSNNANGQDQT